MFAGSKYPEPETKMTFVTCETILYNRALLIALSLSVITSMLRSQLLSPNFSFPLCHLHKPSLPPHLSSFPCNFLCGGITLHTVPAHLRTRPEPWLGRVSEATETAPEEEGPIELPSSTPSIFATTDEPTTLQVATSVLLTGAISVFLFRSLRRRARRAKELKFRSSGAKKSLKEEAIDNLKAMTPAPLDAKSPPSPVQALLGGLTAGVIALILYKFTITIESSLNRQTLSDNLSVRQITITIRTIINGLCYLATFVFGINSIGLLLYSGQLAINSFMGDSTSKETESKDEAQLSSTNLTATSPMDSSDMDSSNGERSSDDRQ